MRNFNLKIDQFKKELKLLDDKEKKYREEIIKNVLAFELFTIALTASDLILNHKIKSKTISNYLCSSKESFDKNFKLIIESETKIVAMEAEENILFKQELIEENNFVKALVKKLNNIFTIQYENYSWETFSSVYKIKKINLKRIDYKLNKLSKKINKANKFKNKEKEINLIEKTLPVKKEKQLKIGIIMHPKMHPNYAYAFK